MVGTLLLRGMLVGIVAGLLCFGFLRVFGEPQVDRAIAFETLMDDAKVKAAADESIAKPMPAEEAELVSRPVQAGIGLLTGVAVYCAAFGGLFALVFAMVNGRLANLSARATSALLAAAGFLSLYVVPNLKYPANPPSVGEPETIGMRTALYFALIAISLAGMIAAVMLRQRLVARHGGWTATLVAGGAYLVFVLAVGLVLPGVNEVPDAFPAVVLWQFRIASIGAQALMWATLGLGFGALAERVTAGPGRFPVTASAP